MNTNKQYNAIDLLKFIMALLVVMIHVQPNKHSDSLSDIFNVVTSIAVPVFFIISSMLVFRKGGGTLNLLGYCKRIGLLYLCWFIIDFWFVYTNKPYFHVGIVKGVTNLLKDVFFATTFPGSWYLSASVVGVVLVYYLNKFLHPIITFVITYLLACYVYRFNMLPESWQGVYEWYAMNIREGVSLSFPGQMIWISIGQLLSTVMTSLDDKKKWLLSVSASAFALSMVLSLFINAIELRVVSSTMIVVACILVDLPSSPIYKRLRNYSILMFFFHFSIAGKMRYFFAIVGDTLLTNWLYYLFVVAVSILFAEAVLRLEKNKYLSFLKYLH